MRPRCMSILIVLVGLILAACGTPTARTLPAIQPVPESSPATSEPPAAASDDVLVQLDFRGGMCREGECTAQTTITRDGTLIAVNGPDPVKQLTLNQADVAALTAEIEAADFDQLKAQPFTGTCPIAFDGREVIYTFYSSKGPQQLASCAVQIDESAPLFVKLNEILAQVSNG